MSSMLGRRTAVAAVAVVLGSVGFAGTALADGNAVGSGGKGGNGGGANANCLIPVGVSAGVVGQGGGDTQCNATGGAAGSGGDGVNY